MIKHQEEVEVLEIEAQDPDTGQEAQIIVYNDEVNTFDWVIQSFVEICKHTLQQAEQLSLIIHFKGKAIVKTGSGEYLRPMASALLDRGLSAELVE